MPIDRSRSGIAAGTLVLFSICSLLIVGAQAQTPGKPNPGSPATTNPTAGSSPKSADDAVRPVAYIYGNIPITRADLGEYMLARGGVDKLNHLVNRTIIEMECKRRNITVTDQEIEAEFLRMLAGLSNGGPIIKKEDFVRFMLAREGKTYFEFMEDTVRPNLMMTKLCHDRVKVDEEDLKKQFEREYGEKRLVQMILWPKGDSPKSIQEIWTKIRDNPVEFDSAARAQARPELASCAGKIKPITKHLNANEKIIETRAFQLKPNEVSEIIETELGFVVMKLLEIIPPNDKVNFEKERKRLYDQAFEERLNTEEIPKYFAELKKAAAPQVLYEGPPQWRFDQNLPRRNALDGVTPQDKSKQPQPTPPATK